MDVSAIYAQLVRCLRKSVQASVLPPVIVVGKHDCAVAFARENGIALGRLRFASDPRHLQGYGRDAKIAFVYGADESPAFREACRMLQAGYFTRYRETAVKHG